MSIGEVARRVAIAPHAIRNYERLGYVRPSSRTSGGIRMYSPTEVSTLLTIKRLKTLELTPSETRQVLAAMGKPVAPSALPPSTDPCLDLLEQHAAAIRQRADMAAQAVEEVRNALDLCSSGTPDVTTES